MKKRLTGIFLRDVILGGQDGLVNVLGIVLGMAAATQESRLVIIAGLAATFAESISMAAVAYTSTKAEQDFNERKKHRNQYTSPITSAWIVGVSAVIGSLLPLFPFLIFSIETAVVFSILLSAISLFITGSLEGKITLRSWFKEGIRMMVIGIIAALAGFLIGKWLGVNV